MSLSRRQFFRRLTRPGQKTPEERKARHELMYTYVRTHLYPYDFSLTEDQEAELLAAVRSDLEATNDEELFSAILHFKVEEVVDRKIRRWREDLQLKDHQHRLNEIRRAAVGYASAFIYGEGTPAAIEQLRARFSAEDLTDLEPILKKRVEDWIGTVDDGELVAYNVVSVRDLVFTQLRSWC